VAVKYSIIVTSASFEHVLSTASTSASLSFPPHGKTPGTNSNCHHTGNRYQDQKEKKEKDPHNKK
jgi:hypothetical protein